MILDDLLKIVCSIIQETVNIDEILKRKEIGTLKLTEMLGKTDQEIDEYIKAKEPNEDRQKLLFEVFQKIKLEQSIENIEDTVAVEQTDNNKKIIQDLFSQIIEPDEIEFKDSNVCLKYCFADNSKLKSKIAEIEKWNRDSVIETISNRLGVASENIVFIESVSAYIEFISSFEENNYVSRGQKDCTFKQRILYYDYYKTDRGYHKRSLNSNGGWNVIGCMSFMNQSILKYSNKIRSAVLVMHGEKAHSCYFSRDAYAAMVKDNPYADNKELLIIPGQTVRKPDIA